MKKIISICTVFILFLWLAMFIASCTPVRVVETYTTDSTGKSVRTKVKYYEQTDRYSIQPDIHITTVPFFYNRTPIFIPTYRAPLYVPTYRAPITRGYGTYGLRHRH